MMPRTFLILVSGLACAAAALGWVSASAFEIDIPAAEDNWDERLADITRGGGADKDAQRYERLVSSAFMPLSSEARLAQQAALAATRDSAPPFPQIVGAAIINGRAQVHVIIDGAIEAKQSGDQMATGWEIISVSMDEVVAQFDGEIKNFAILDY